MWVEAYKIVVYTVNRTFIKRLDWKILFEMFIKSIFLIVYIYLFGCRAYVMISKIRRFDKILPRAQIGYFVGYDFINVFRVWILLFEKVIRIRDIRFNNNRLYNLSDIDLSVINSAEV